jgi:hypothetical protein
LDGFFQLLLFRKCNDGDHQSSKINNDHIGLIQFLAHSESPPLTESKRKPCQLSCVNIIMFFKVLANISLNSEVLSPSGLLPVNLVPKGCIIK